MLAQQYVYRILRLCGQLRPGWMPSVELIEDCLQEWVVFFDALGADRNTNYSNPVYQYDVTGPGSQTGGNGYTIGPSGADFTGPRPNSIFKANCVMLNQGPSPVYLPMRSVTQEEWASLAILQIPGINITNLFWYDPQWPNGVLNVFPPITGNAIQLYQWGILQPPAYMAFQATTQGNNTILVADTTGLAVGMGLSGPGISPFGTTVITAITSNVSITVSQAATTSAATVLVGAADYTAPPGYQDMIEYSLAERFYPRLTKAILPHPVSLNWLSGMAYEKLQAIRNVNRPIPTLPLDAPTGGMGRDGAPLYDSFVYLTGTPY